MDEETKRFAKAQAAKYLEPEEGPLTQLTNAQFWNVEPFYRDCLNMAREALEEGGKYPVDYMAEVLEDYLHELTAPKDPPTKDNPAGVYTTDLIAWALQQVDRYAIAAGFIDAVADED